MLIFLTMLLALSVLIEGILTTIPLTLVCLICLTVMKRDTSIFLPAFLAGLFIDLFRVQTIGTTSIFFVCFVFLVLLYKKKYEIYSTPFVMLATFLGAFFFLMIFGITDILTQSLISAVIAALLFVLLRFFVERKEQKQKTRFLAI